MSFPPTVHLGQSIHRPNAPVTHFLTKLGAPYCRTGGVSHRLHPAIATRYQEIPRSDALVDCQGCTAYVQVHLDLVPSHHSFMRNGAILLRYAPRYDRRRAKIVAGTTTLLVAREEHFAYPGYGTAMAECDLYLWRRPDGSHVALCTDPGDDYEGLSITNGVERAAETILHTYAFIDPERLTVVERYLPGRVHGPSEDFTQVKLSWDAGARKYRNPSWMPATRDEFVALINQPFEG